VQERYPGKDRYPSYDRVRLLIARGDLEPVRDGTGARMVLPLSELEKLVRLFYWEEVVRPDFRTELTRLLVAAE
jgi:hypothetical protein